MHTGTMNRRQLVDTARGRLDRAHVAKADVTHARIRLEAELEDVVAREATCDVEIDAARQALNEAARAPENAAAAFHDGRIREDSPISPLVGDKPLGSADPLGLNQKIDAAKKVDGDFEDVGIGN